MALPPVALTVDVDQVLARALRVRATALGRSPEVVHRMALVAFLGRSDGPLHPFPRGENAHRESLADAGEWGSAALNGEGLL